MSRACDEVVAATEAFLAQYRGQFPLLASFCPAVVRLVQVKYPELVEQLLPILPPREAAARYAKARAQATTGLPAEKIGAVYITPCPSKMVAIAEHPGLERSCLDAAVSIRDLYGPLASALRRARVDVHWNEETETAGSVRWAFLGGYTKWVPAENTLSVAGLPNVIRILDDIEKGKLQKYTFVEAQACPEGCVSGPLTVENPYVARANVVRLMRRLPSAPNGGRDAAARAALLAEYQVAGSFEGRPLRPLDDDISRAIAKAKEKDRILSHLLRIDCGACGSPNCETFAEDIVLGEADEAGCVFLWQEKVADQMAGLSALMRAARGRKKPAEDGRP